MKLHCHRSSLVTALGVVSGVVPSRTPKDILKNVKLELRDGKATLIGTDQEIGIRYDLPAVESDASGEVLLPTNRVMSILRELQDDAVEFELTDEAIWLRGGHSEFKLASEDPSEFPPVAAFEDDQYYAVPAGVFKEMIRRTVFATDVESTRYALGGVLVEADAEKITLAATDSRRLAVMHTVCEPVGIDGSATVEPVVPAKAMSLIERSISDDEEPIHIAIHDNDVLVKSAHCTVTSRLVEGRFPRYQDVIPKEAGTIIDLAVGPLHSAVRQAQIVTNEESRGVEFRFSDGMLTLNSAAADVGESKVELPISYDGEAITITFDPRFIADFLRILDAQSVVHLELKDGESAAVFRTGDAYTYVIMPLSRDR